MPGRIEYVGEERGGGEVHERVAEKVALAVDQSGQMRTVVIDGGEHIAVPQIEVDERRSGDHGEDSALSPHRRAHRVGPDRQDHAPADGVTQSRIDHGLERARPVRGARPVARVTETNPQSPDGGGRRPRRTPSRNGVVSVPGGRDGSGVPGIRRHEQPVVGLVEHPCNRQLRRAAAAVRR